MHKHVFSYPQYRKYVGLDKYFKIESPDKFVELSRIGGKLLTHEVKAIQYPEKLLIQDMLSCLESRWELVLESDYLSFERVN